MFLPPPPLFTKEITYYSSFSEHLRVSRITPGQNYFSPNTEKAFRKYYGKSVTKLLHEQQSSSLRPANRYKALQSFKALVYSLSGMDRCPSKDIKHLDIEYCSSNKLKKKPKGIVRKITQCKHLESLRMYRLDTYSYKNIRKFRQLQALDLTLTEKQLVDNSKYLSDLANLRSMRNISMHLASTKEKPDLDKAIELIILILASKHLQFVCLDLKSGNWTSTLLNPLLRQIEQTNLPSFNISLTNYYQDSISMELLDAALNKVDLFSFLFNSDVSRSFASHTAKSQNMSLDQAKRILNLRMLFSADMDNASPIIFPVEHNSFNTGLNDLFKMFFVRSIPLVPNISNITGLKKLSLDLVKTKPYFSAGKELVHVLKQATALEHLILHDRRLRLSSEAMLNQYELLAAEIKNLKNLTTLDLSFTDLTHEFLLLNLQPVLYLTNLKSFRFYYGAPPRLDLSEMDFSIAFPENSQLIELDIKLPVMNSESKLNFITAIGKLTELQQIDIMVGTQLLNEEESRKLLMKTLLGLTQLREASTTDETNFAPPPELSEEEKQENEKVAAELRDYTEKIFQKNRNLERIYMKKRCCYEIKYIRY